MRYRAFLSYSHRDARWARWLHRALEGYRIPTRLRGTSGEFGPLPERLSPIFRDRDDLATAGYLSPRIDAALADSEAIVVVCSPEAARSPWVNEEILRFKRLGRGERIYCLIVAGSPNSGGVRECFPPALRLELDDSGQPGTEPVEPAAADVRPGGDGKRLARLKLLSGLLGVELNTLRQREAARRHRRMLVVAAISAIVALATSALAVQAVIARNAAERRQKQAEALVGFMLGDLSDRLSQVSRLDIMQSVNDQAMRYFRALPTTDVTDQSLEQRAVTLVKIGSVRRDQGDLPGALESYRAAEAMTSTLAADAPQDMERQLAHAGALTYIGTTLWYRGEPGQAEDSFSAAQAVLLRARPLSENDPALLYQLSTLDNNLGNVRESRGHLDRAMDEYRDMLAVSRELVRIAPDNRDWSSQLGLAHNNLARMALLQGDLPGATAGYQADLDIASNLARRDGRDNSQAEKVLISRAALGRTLALGGDVEQAIAQLRESVAEVARLLAVDPANTSFIEDDGLYSLQLARLLRIDGQADEASVLANRSLATFERLTHQDPAHAGWQRSLGVARIELGEDARDQQRNARAAEHARQALALLDPLQAVQPDNRETLLATLRARLLLASVDEHDAERLLQATLRDARAVAAGADDPRLVALEAETLLALDLKDEAAALLPDLWRTGFRDRQFIGLLHDAHMPLPTTASAALVGREPAP